MADNALLPATGTGTADMIVTSDEVTYSGDVSKLQIVKLAQVTGSEGSKTVVDLPGDATNGLDVDVTRLPALVEGTANIGDVDVLTVPADPFGANADAASATGSISAKLRFIAATGIPVTSSALPSGASTLAEQQAQTASLSVLDDWDNAASDGVSVSGDVAHGSSDAGEPVKIGYKALAHGANPTAVSAAQRTNSYADRHGIPWVHNGHPFVRSFVYNTTGAQTDDALLAAISSGTKYVIVGYHVRLSSAATVAPSVLIGWGASTLPALGASGADGVEDLIDYHPSLVPGAGFGQDSCYIPGGDGIEPRITCTAPTSGTLAVVIRAFTIES